MEPNHIEGVKNITTYGRYFKTRLNVWDFVNINEANEVMRSCKSKKDKQCNEKKQDKSTNTDHQNITPETKGKIKYRQTDQNKKQSFIFHYKENTAKLSFHKPNRKIHKYSLITIPIKTGI
jgi:hypothetical protein